MSYSFKPNKKHHEKKPVGVFRKAREPWSCFDWWWRRLEFGTNEGPALLNKRAGLKNLLTTVGRLMGFITFVLFSIESVNYSRLAFILKDCCFTKTQPKLHMTFFYQMKEFLFYTWHSIFNSFQYWKKPVPWSVLYDDFTFLPKWGFSISHTVLYFRLLSVLQRKLHRFP